MTTTRRLSAEHPWTSSSHKTGPRPAVPVPAEAAYMSARQYCDRLGGISFMTLARTIKRDPEFPHPVYFGRLRYFKVRDIEAYEHLREVKSAAKTLAANS